MSKILFRLNGAPDDEIEEVRELLTQHAIDFYETPPGNWGVSIPALWVTEEDQFEQARTLLDAYQRERSNRIKNELLLLKQTGANKTFIDMIKQNPMNFTIHLVVALLVIYLSIRLIWDLGQ